jgi:general secretion pathway protein G
VKFRLHPSLRLPLCRRPQVRHGRRGFTLIELLIGVALVAVLVGLGLPAWNEYRNKVRVRQAVQDITQMQAVIRQHFDETRSYPADLAAVGLSGRLDPWGRAYQYYNIAGGTIGSARKNRSLNPLNTDFDLYSKGPDNDSALPLTSTKSDDDILRANNGSYVGRGVDY